MNINIFLLQKTQTCPFNKVRTGVGLSRVRGKTACYNHSNCSKEELCCWHLDQKLCVSTAVVQPVAFTSRPRSSDRGARSEATLHTMTQTFLLFCIKAFHDVLL